MDVDVFTVLNIIRLDYSPEEDPRGPLYVAPKRMDEIWLIDRKKKSSTETGSESNDQEVFTIENLETNGYIIHSPTHPRVVVVMVVI